jgi:hypothetical protein
MWVLTVNTPDLDQPNLIFRDGRRLVSAGPFAFNVNINRILMFWREAEELNIHEPTDL